MNALMSDVISCYKLQLFISQTYRHVLIEILIEIDNDSMFLHLIRIRISIILAFDYFVLYSSTVSTHVSTLKYARDMSRIIECDD